MTSAQAVTSLVLLGTLVLQAAWPARRLLVVLTGALASLFAAARLTASGPLALFGQVPWDVLVIVVALGLFSEVLASTRAFGLLAVSAAKLSRASPKRLLFVFVVGMYAVSGLVNNLTALLLVLPVLLNLLKLLGASQRYVTWTLGAMLVACNLGGAATPVGDFPAILLLGRGAMGFSDYLARALPQTLVAMAGLAVAVLLARPDRDTPRDPLVARIALTTVGQLYRGVTVDRSLLVPGVGVLASMLAAWLLLPASWGVGPELVAWLGAALVLWLRPALGEALLRRKVDLEAVLFLLALFLMVGAVRAAGTFELIAQTLPTLPISPKAQVLLFLVVASLVTAVFSAGPGMAALLDVAQTLAQRHPPHAVYVGLAMAVCAGSSLFLTAATAGPLAQALTERAQVRVGERTATFGFFDYAPVGLVGYAVTLAAGLGFVWVAL